jgi:uncharacterized RDD family membrane protein YckC
MPFEMNTIAHASVMPASGPQLDNRRVIAAIADLLVVVAGALAIGFAAGLPGSGLNPPGVALTGVLTAWALYYYFACESAAGQTLGKRLMNIRVVKLDGGPAGMRDIALRTVLRLIDGLFLYLVGLIVMLATGERRGRLGDLVGGTMIVSADASEPPAAPVVRPAVAPPPITLPAVEPVPGEPDRVAQPGPVPPAAPHPEDDEPQVVVNSMEAVSAIDLVMEAKPVEDPSAPHA